MAIKLPSHLQRSRSGIFHFRITIPPDLHSYFDTKEIYRSLRTASVRDAVDIAQALSAAFKRLFKEFRGKAMLGEKELPQFLSDKHSEDEGFVIDVELERERLGEQFMSLMTKGSELKERDARVVKIVKKLQLRAGELQLSERTADKKALEIINQKYFKLDCVLDKLTIILMKNKEASNVLNIDFMGLFKELNTMGLSAQHQKILKAQTENHQIEKKYLADFVTGIAAKATTSLAASVVLGPLLSQTIDDLARAKLAQSRWTKKTKEENLAIYNLFIRIVGDIPIANIDNDIIVTYLETLKKLPPNINKSPAYIGKHIPEIIALSPPPMEVRTINKNLERISSLFIWAIQRPKYNITRNPAAGMSLDESDSAKRLPFTEFELSALFGSEEFVTRKFQNPYAYWLMPMGLLTGARLGELSQLYLTDFVTYKGVSCIAISDEKEGQRLKNNNAKRLVPIHDKLIELGLLRYVDTLQKRNEVRLFPELSQRSNGFAQTPSNWFQRHKDKCGVQGKYIKVFHSFRHTFISTLLDNDVPEQAVAQIVGHEANLITGKIYWNAKDASKRKPTVDNYRPPEEVWRLIPKFEEITITKRRGPK